MTEIMEKISLQIKALGLISADVRSSISGSISQLRITLVWTVQALTLLVGTTGCLLVALLACRFGVCIFRGSGAQKLGCSEDELS